MSAGHTELRPCPFCGGEAEIRGTDSTSIQCMNNQCIIGDPAPFNDFTHRQDAIAAWNTRAIEAAEADLLGRCLEALRARIEALRSGTIEDEARVDERIRAILSQAREVK